MSIKNTVKAYTGPCRFLSIRKRWCPVRSRLSNHFCLPVIIVNRSVGTIFVASLFDTALIWLVLKVLLRRTLGHVVSCPLGNDGVQCVVIGVSVILLWFTFSLQDAARTQSSSGEMFGTVESSSCSLLQLLDRRPETFYTYFASSSSSSCSSSSSSVSG